jgi:hypothetical protein
VTPNSLVRECRIGPLLFVALVVADIRSARRRGAGMPQYLIYFNQQWVGDHDEAWFESRVEPSTAVVREMQDQGVLIYAGGLVEELEEAASADATSGELVFTDGPFAETKEWLGGLTIVDVPDDESARMWAGKVAEGCGWPQEVRRFKAGSLQALVLEG